MMLFDYIALLSITFLRLQCNGESFKLRADILLDTKHEIVRNYSYHAVLNVVQRFNICKPSVNQMEMNFCWFKGKNNSVHHLAVIQVNDWCHSLTNLNKDIKEINEYFKDSTNKTSLKGERKTGWPLYVLSISLSLYCNQTENEDDLTNACNHIEPATGSQSRRNQTIPKCLDMKVSNQQGAMPSKTSTKKAPAYMQGFKAPENISSKGKFTKSVAPSGEASEQKAEDDVSKIVGSTVGTVAALSGLVAAASFIRRKFKKNIIDPDNQSDNSSVNSDSPFFVPSELSRPATPGRPPPKTAF